MFWRDRKKWWTHVSSLYLKCWCMTSIAQQQRQKLLTRQLMFEQIFQNLHILLGAPGTHWDSLNADSSLPAAARVSQDQTLNGADWMLFIVDGSLHPFESQSLNITPTDFLFSNLTPTAGILRTSVFYTAGFEPSSVFRSVLSDTSLKGFTPKMWKAFHISKLCQQY